MTEIIVDLPLPKRLNSKGLTTGAGQNHFRGIGF